MSLFISPGELDAGQTVIIHNRKKVTVLVPTMEGPKEQEVNPEPHPLTGIPIKIVAVQLPFVLVSFLGKIPNAPPTITLDTRECEFIEGNTKFVQIYQELNWPTQPATEKKPAPKLGGLLELLGTPIILPPREEASSKPLKRKRRVRPLHKKG